MGTHRYLNSDSPGNKEMTMHLFRDRARATDPLWDVASATQVLVADPKSVMSLAPEPAPGEPDKIVDGVLVATRHPTGWFLHAVRRDDMSEDQVEAFRELVTVRSYLLLSRGAEEPAWRSAPLVGEWRSVWFSIARELSELDDALVD